MLGRFQGAPDISSTHRPSRNCNRRFFCPRYFSIAAVARIPRFGRPPKDPRPDCGAAGILRRPFDHSRPALSAFRTWAGDAGMSPSGPSGTCPACQAMSALGGKPEVHALDPFVTSQFGPKRTFGSIHGHKKVPDDAGGLLP
jgi:hypothetical protein